MSLTLYPLQLPTILHMLVHLKAHVCKIENMLTKKRIDTMFESAEFKVCPSFTTDVIISNPNVPEWFTRSSPGSVAVPWHTCVCYRCHTTDDGKFS